MCFNVVLIHYDTIFFSKPLSRTYLVSDLIWRRIAGLSVDNSFQLVKAKSSKLNGVIVHERLHQPPFDLSDLTDEEELSKDNIMIYRVSDKMSKLRNRELRRKFESGTEKQWDIIRRDVKF